VGNDYAVLFKPRRHWAQFRVLWFTADQLLGLRWDHFKMSVYDMLNKPQRPVKGPGGSHTIVDAKLRKLMPSVVEYLESCAYEDGTLRKSSTISLFAEGKLIKVSLNDRDNSRTLWAEGESLEDAWRLLERLLSLPEPPWRWWTPDQLSGARKQPRKA